MPTYWMPVWNRGADQGDDYDGCRVEKVLATPRDVAQSEAHDFPLVFAITADGPTNLLRSQLHPTRRAALLVLRSWLGMERDELAKRLAEVEQELKEEPV